MSNMPDFDDNEIKLISDTLKERYTHDVEKQHADIELRIDKGDRELTECPAVYWEEGKCHLILAKTGKTQYDDLFDCPVTTLRVQADHELQRNEVKNL